MQEGRWTKIGGLFTVIGTVVAIVAFFSGDKHHTTPTGGYENSPEVRSSRSPGQTPNSTSTRQPVSGLVDLNGDGVSESFIKRCLPGDPPVCEIKVYELDRLLGTLYGDEVSAILPSKTDGYSDIAVLRKKSSPGAAAGSSGTIYIYKWNGESYTVSE